MDEFSSFVNTVGGNPTSGLQVTQGTNPSTRQKLWDVPVASLEDVERAIASARIAFKDWSQSSWSQRQDSLVAARDILVAHRSKLATLLTKEGGKPIEFSRLEIDHSANFLQYNASQEPIEEVIIQDDKELKLSIHEKPLGVVVAICPWNYPLVLAIGKVAAALVTGNCVIVKPSPCTPYSILKVVELFQSVFPAGVLQALNGDEKLGPTLCSHAGIDKISFTGSTASGKKIAEVAGRLLKPVTLELGGNNASIICPDADPQVVAPQVALGSFMNSGQLCVASKRIFVHEDIYDEFLKVMVETVKQWKVAPTSTLESGIMLGPIQNEMQYNIVKRFFEDSSRNGYKFALGCNPKDSDQDFIIQPAIIDNPPDNALAVTGEAFGPIVPLLKWRNDGDVIRRANSDPSGLGGAVWSRDVDRARRLADQIEAGTVWINGFERPLPQAHLSGYKESGLGGEWGRKGLLAYCKPKVIHLYKSKV
ncbi:aldehyde dehydrogenase domain-containing protein [Fusarium solani]|uniref:aldehyde dehydrogenase (NAD(+)) n=1 Tax=Fusarium solani TaxID=169388 RepID=A0A9P9GM33_FUSSL|nr:aldehyde dehydrogenase domain-containing protein [Fusarium solani]KAH7240474.1 aldehyde dehydrogenase domain-containing protein [Fusarium solani]